MDIKRVMSGVLGLPLVIVILILANNIIVDILFAITALISIHEYFNAVSKISKPVRWIGYISCVLIAFIHIIPIGYLVYIAIVSIPTIIMILFSQVVATDMGTTFKDIAYTFFGIFYVVFFIAFLSLIFGMENGKMLIWYVIIAAWGTDIFAYTAGKHFGKHKFSKVSPKKSIEGCLGGTIGAVIIALIYTFFINTYLGANYSYLFVTGISIILSLVGQIGDFSASSIKRFVEVKDYGDLIPGHGGMLDRIDSLIFIAPFAYILFTIL